MEGSTLKHHLLLHLVVLIFGFTGILGKLITVSSEVLVTYRMMIAVSTLAVVYAFEKRSMKLPWRLLVVNTGIGAMTAAHWVLFFESIKQSTVAVTMVCLATAPFMVSFVEPIFYRRPVRLYEPLLGVVALAGLGIIFRVEFEYKTGILLGVGAAAISAFFTVFNGMQMQRGLEARVVSFYQLGFGFVCVGTYSLVRLPLETGSWSLYGLDWLYLLILGSVCTAFAYIASIQVMKVLSPFTTLLTINLEPLYAIVLALVIFGESEKMSFGFYMGALLILATVAGNVMIKRRLAPEVGLSPQAIRE